ncbi:hypothetical protein VPH35_068243 [Triticum aestivum]
MFSQYKRRPCHPLRAPSPSQLVSSTFVSRASPLPIEMCSTMFASLALLLAQFCATSLLFSAASTMPDCHSKIPANFPPPDTMSTSVLCVDPSGCCRFTKVQRAIDSIPENSSKRTILWINKGTYFEKVRVTKPNITFQGQGLMDTFIVWNDTAKTSSGTTSSGSVDIKAAGFIAKNISFKNSAPVPKPGDEGGQALAIRLSGDQAALWGCGFFGAQDTLFDDVGRHYFKDCFIEGSVDFIFGNARSLFENCILNSIAEAKPTIKGNVNAAITAQARESEANHTGFSFVNCTIKGTSEILLGRAYRPYSRVIFAHTYISNILASQGWSDFGKPSNQRTVFYGEYMCTGEGAKRTERVPYSRSLTDDEVRPYLNSSYVDGEDWLKPFDDALITS